MAKKAMSFEESLNRLDTITKLLEDGTVSLEESLKLFEEGTGLAAKCAALLDQAEQRITKLTNTDSQIPNIEDVNDEQKLSD